MNYIKRARDHRSINDQKYRTLAHLESLENKQFQNLSNTIVREKIAFNNLQSIQINSIQQQNEELEHKQYENKEIRKDYTKPPRKFYDKYVNSSYAEMNYS